MRFLGISTTVNIFALSSQRNLLMYLVGDKTCGFFTPDFLLPNALLFLSLIAFYILFATAMPGGTLYFVNPFSTFDSPTWG